MHADFVALLSQLALMLACGLVGGAVMRRLHQPTVLGEMLGGILLGPTVFGLLWPAGYAQVFDAGPGVAAVRGGVVQLGMLFFLLVVGIEIDLAGLRRSATTALLVGTIGVAVPLAAGVGMVYLWPGLWNVPAEVGRSAFAIYIGVCMANTANPVLARILTDLGLMKERLGSMVMASAVIDDFIGWSLLAVILTRGEASASSAGASLFAGTAVVVAFAVVLAVVVRFIGSPLLTWTRKRLPWPTGFLSVVVIYTLAASAAAEHFGIHAFLGALLLGVVLSPTTEERSEAYAAIEHFALSFFVPIYFVSFGLTTDFVANFHWPLVLAVLGAACVTKIGACAGAARLSGLDARTSLAVACGMNARGAMGVLLAGIGLENGIIDHPTYVALIVMAVVTSLAAGPLMQGILKRSTATADAPSTAQHG